MWKAAPTLTVAFWGKEQRLGTSVSSEPDWLPVCSCQGYALCPRRTHMWMASVHAHAYAQAANTHATALDVFFLVFLLIPCILCSPFGHNYDCFAGSVLQLSRVEQMSTAQKDPMLLHSRTNEDVKKSSSVEQENRGKRQKE